MQIKTRFVLFLVFSISLVRAPYISSENVADEEVQKKYQDVKMCSRGDGNVLVVGTGYVGLVTGTCFADKGFSVTCLDIDEAKIKKLQNGIIPIYEPGLSEMVKRNVEDNRLSFTTSYKEAVEYADVIFLAVNTPISPSGAADLKAVKASAKTIGKYLNHYTVVVNKSTAPVGTLAMVRETIEKELEERGVVVPFDVASNPEFLKEGTAMEDFMNPDRVVIGCETERAKNLMLSMYAPFGLSEKQICMMDVPSAELTKYASNAMLALRISFMNWVGNLAEKTGGDITKIKEGVGSDKRIGSSFLSAGIGFGGSCFPKDVQALEIMGEENGMDTSLLKAVRTINADQKEVLFNKMDSYFSSCGGLSGKTIGVLGLAFKPDTDDMREAPSIVLINQLTNAGCNVRVYDPVAMENAKTLISADSVTFCLDEMDLATGCDAIALVTEWKQFRLLDYQQIHEIMAGNVFFDGRNIFKPHDLVSRGFDYISIGRQPVYVGQLQMISSK